MKFVVIERDSDGDIVNVHGIFRSSDAAMTWLKEVCIPQWAKEYEDDTGHKANIGFFGNGASDGSTCTYWLVKEIWEVD